MTKEKVEGSPISRAKLVLGAAPPGASTLPSKPRQQEEAAPATEHKDIKTQKAKAAEPSVPMTRTTVYMPEALHIKLKMYAARHKQDVSGIITSQIEKLLAEEE